MIKETIVSLFKRYRNYILFFICFGLLLYALFNLKIQVNQTQHQYQNQSQWQATIIVNGRTFENLKFKTDWYNIECKYLYFSCHYNVNWNKYINMPFGISFINEVKIKDGNRLIIGYWSTHDKTSSATKKN